MSLPTTYMRGTKNVPKILDRIIEGAPPAKFTQAHLKSLGFAGSNERSIIPFLKAIGFLTSDGTPTQLYNDYRDKSRSKRVLGTALRQKFSSLFQVNENLSEADRAAIEGKFKSEAGMNEDQARSAAATFLAFWRLADHSARSSEVQAAEVETSQTEEEPPPVQRPRHRMSTGLHYNIEIHLPATKDIEVFNAIFRALRENLLEE